MKTADYFIEKIEKAKIAWNYNKALETALEWLKNYMNDYRFYEELADIHIYWQDLEKAEEAISYARELHPNSGTWIFLEWFITMEKWDFENALKIFEKSNQLLQNNAEIIKNIGWCNVMLGNMEKWISILRRAQSIDPQSPNILYYLNTAIMLNNENPNK